MSETRHSKMVRLTLTIPSQNRGIGTRPSLVSSFALLAFLMPACPAWAAITFDSNAEGTAASGTTYSFNHTLGTGSNKAIVVGVIVIVGGLASRLLLSVFLSPVLYSLVARDGDTLQV